MSSTTKASGAELIVAQLSSLDQEEVHRNAEKKVVHSVIKNIPFSIVLGLRGTFDPYAVDFHKFTLNSTLLYDTHGEERIVDWVKSSPIDCVVQVNETGERATAEVRLQSLSSQHEDMAFRIKFTAEPPSSSNLQPLVVVTEPIKVVSKQSQLKKNKKPPATRTKKRAAPAADSELLADSLARIEAQQRQQQTLINTLIQTVSILQQSKSQAVADESASPQYQQDDSEVRQPMRKRVKTEQRDLDQPSPNNLSPSCQEASQQFEHHLSGLMATFSQLPPEDRASSIHRVFRDYSDHAGEVVEALLAESLTKGEDEVYTPTGATADLSSFDSNFYDMSYSRTESVPDAEAFFQQALLLRPKAAPRES